MRRAINLATAAAVAAAMTFSVTSTAQADQGAYYDHVQQCAIWLLTDADAHSANCLPSRISPGLSSLSGFVNPGPEKPTCSYSGKKSGKKLSKFSKQSSYGCDSYKPKPKFKKKIRLPKKLPRGFNFNLNSF